MQSFELSVSNRDTTGFAVVSQAQLVECYRYGTTLVWCDLRLKFLDYEIDTDSFSIFSHYPFPPGTVQSQLIVEFGLTFFIHNGELDPNHTELHLANSFHVERELNTHKATWSSL